MTITVPFTALLYQCCSIASLTNYYILKDLTYIAGDERYVNIFKKPELSLTNQVYSVES